MQFDRGYKSPYMVTDNNTMTAVLDKPLLLIAELTAKRRQIIATIEELPPIEYDFLFRMYAKGESLYTISEAYNYSYQWALSTHAKAIKKLQKRLDASVNN